LAKIGVIDESITLADDFLDFSAGLIFDPKEVEKEGQKTIEEAKKQLEKLKNTRDGFLLKGKEESKKDEDTTVEDEFKRLEAINKIREEFRLKNLEIEEEDNLAKLERQFERDEIELIRLEATEEQKYELRKYYNNLIAEEQQVLIDQLERDEIDAEDERLRKLGEKAKKEIAIEETVANLKKEIKNKALGLLIALGGKAEKIGKALALADVIRTQVKSVSQVISSTIAANAKAVQLSPATGGQPFVAINTGQAVSSILSSATAVARAVSQIKSGSTSAGGGGGSFSGGGGGTQAPSFNLIEGTQQNQLNESIQASNNTPVEAYVVSTSMSTQQEADRNKIDESSI